MLEKTAKVNEATLIRDPARWPIRAFALGEEPGDDLSTSTTPRERLLMMWPLAVEAWLLSGRSIPSYDRSDTPARIFRQGRSPSSNDTD